MTALAVTQISREPHFCVIVGPVSKAIDGEVTRQFFSSVNTVDQKLEVYGLYRQLLVRTPSHVAGLRQMTGHTVLGFVSVVPVQREIVFQASDLEGPWARWLAPNIDGEVKIG